MNWARIDGDRVAEITDIDPEGRFHSSIKWIECSTEVRPGWSYDAGRFSPPAPSQWHEWVGGEWVEDESAALDDAKALQTRKINDAYTAAAAPLIRDYPELETKTWPQQDAEASTYLSWHDDGEQDDPPATPVLDRILAGRNGDDGTETLYELCLAVRANAELFTQAQELTGRRQRLVRQIRQAETVEEVEAVVWSE